MFTTLNEPIEIQANKRPRLFWTPYAAHNMDLMLEDFEKKIHRPAMTHFASSYLA